MSSTRKIIFVALAIVAVKLLLSHAMVGPWFEPDESTYAVKAWHVSQGELAWQHPERGMGSPGYAFVCAPLWWMAGGDADLFLRLVSAQNALLAAMAFVILVSVFRRHVRLNAALACAAGAVLYGPVFLYGFAVLSENAALPLLAMALWIAQRMRHLRWWHWPAMALVCGAAIAVRSALLPLALAAFSVLMTHIWSRHRTAAIVLIAGAVTVCLTGLGLMASAGVIFNKAELARQWRDHGWMIVAAPLSAMLCGVAYLGVSGFGLLPIAAIRSVARRLRRLQPEAVFVAAFSLASLAMYGLMLGRSVRPFGDYFEGRYLDLVGSLMVGYGLMHLFTHALSWRMALMGSLYCVASLVALWIAKPLWACNLAFQPSVWLVLIVAFLWGIGYVAQRIRRSPAVLSMLAVVVVTLFGVMELRDFRAPFVKVQMFGKMTREVLREAPYSEFYVDQLPVDSMQLHYMRMFATASMEMWNPGMTERFVGDYRRVPAGSILLSAWPLEAQVLVSIGPLRLYHVLPAATLAAR